MNRRIHNKKQVQSTRKMLRNNATKAERILWKHIRNSRVGYKFRRQQSIDRYVVDFYCPALKLIVEVDGNVHGEMLVRVRDKNREAYIQALGFVIVRYTNEQVMYELENVLIHLKNLCDSLSV